MSRFVFKVAREDTYEVDMPLEEILKQLSIQVKLRGTERKDSKITVSGSVYLTDVRKNTFIYLTTDVPADLEERLRAIATDLVLAQQSVPHDQAHD